MRKQRGEHCDQSEREQQGQQRISGHLQDDIGLGIERRGGHDLPAVIKDEAALERRPVFVLAQAILP